MVGQNGAGKTTLARVFAGLQIQDSGTVEINGLDVPAGDHRAARRAGVDMVYQQPSLVPDLTVAEALELRTPRGAVGGYWRRGIERRWAAYLAEHDIEVDVRRRVRDLPLEIVQSIEIAPLEPRSGRPADTRRTDLGSGAGPRNAPVRAAPLYRRRGASRSSSCCTNWRRCARSPTPCR